MFTSVTQWFMDLADEVLDTYGRDSRLGRAGLVLFLGAGVLAGGASLLLFPRPFFEDLDVAVPLGLVAAILGGALVAGFSGVKLLDWQFKFNLERFGAGFCVTLALGVTRLVWFVLQAFR